MDNSQTSPITDAPAAALQASHPSPNCRRGAVLVLNKLDGSILIIPARCKQWTCSSCGPRLRDSWADRIATARPKRFITLTCDPKRFRNPSAAYESMKAALPKLVALIRKKIGMFEYVAIWELHESGWPHLHVAQKGNYVPQAFLSRAWQRLGIGSVVDIRQVTTIRGTARYVSKYITKTISETKGDLRITKVIQSSRLFFTKPPPAKQAPVLETHEIAYSPSPTYRVLDYLIGVLKYMPCDKQPANAYRLYPPTYEKALTNLDPLVYLDVY